MAASARRISVAASPTLASKATLPLPRMVLTAPNPAASKLRLRSGMVTYIGLTPRKNARYRVMTPAYTPAPVRDTRRHASAAPT